MAKTKKRKPQKKSKPKKPNVGEYIIGALIDLLVGILLIIISKWID